MKTAMTRIVALLMTLVSLMALLPCTALAAKTYQCDEKTTIEVTTTANIGDCKLQIAEKCGTAVYKTKDGKHTVTRGEQCTLKIVATKCGNGKVSTYTLSSSASSVTLKFNWLSSYIVTVTPKNPTTIKSNGYTFYFDHWEKVPVWYVSTKKGILYAN